ncbi:MAG: FYDLN acid domain-containing protein [Holophagaceae bacterium]|uniref:FYDLN acid domain-containing protein n=1 Tax=Candidatus Geothrix odensensis TaxID=2954440 RepID=A0A936K6L6_9BACT|nr:FYDLN acid domain-containing protein [Candidatus Geothrix odensensis]
MADLGKKFTCFQCAAKFYDFGKPEALCPKCGANQKTAPAKPKAVKKENQVGPGLSRDRARSPRREDPPWVSIMSR